MTLSQFGAAVGEVAASGLVYLVSPDGVVTPLALGDYARLPAEVLDTHQVRMSLASALALVRERQARS